MRLITLLAFCLCFCIGKSNIFTSVQSGNILSSTTWNSGVPPTKNDTLIISENHEISINNASLEFNCIELSGTLKWNSSHTFLVHFLNCSKNAILKSNFVIGTLSCDSLLHVFNGKLNIQNTNIQCTNNTILNGEIIFETESSFRQFKNITIHENGSWNNKSSCNPVISGNINNNGNFTACKDNACTYYFTENTYLSGNTLISIPHCNSSALLFNNGKLEITHSIEGSCSLHNAGELHIYSSPLTFQVNEFNTSYTNNSVYYENHEDQNIFQPLNGFYQNLFLKNGRKFLTQDLLVKNKLNLSDSAKISMGIFNVNGNNSAQLYVDSTSMIQIGNNENEASSGFPVNFIKTLLHPLSTVVYQSKKNETIDSKVIYGNLWIDDGAVQESIKIISNDSLNIQGNFWIAESSVKVKCNECKINVKGDWDGIGNLQMNKGTFYLKGNGNNYGILYPGNSKVIYNGNENQLLKIGEYYQVEINKSLGKAIIKGNDNIFKANKLLQIKGKLEIGNETMIITDSLIIRDHIQFTSTQQSRTIKNVNIKENGKLECKSPTKINVNGNWINDGIFVQGESTIAFTDTITAQFIKGNNSFFKMEIQKKKSSLFLSNDIIIQNILFLKSGKINLLDHHLYLNNTAKIQGENNENYITAENGSIHLEKNISANSTDSIGGLGLIVESKNNWGNTLFIRKHKRMKIEGRNTILRQFEIHPQFNSNLNEKVSFNFLNHELENNTKNKLQLFKSENETDWYLMPAQIDTSNNKIVGDKINSFSTWTMISKLDDPLAVNEIMIQWNRIETNLLEWTTLGETQIQEFCIQISSDGINFNDIDCVPTNAEHSTTNHYQYKVNRLREAKYVRIMSIDGNGQENFSQSINYETIGSENIFISNSILYNHTGSPIFIYDESGKLIYNGSNLNNKEIDLSKWSAGLYIFKCGRNAGKFVII